MKQTLALAAFATLALVGPAMGQQVEQEHKRSVSQDPLDVLARKAALRLAGFNLQEGEDSDAAGLVDVAKPKLKVYYDEDTGMLMVDGPPEEIARFEHAYELVIEKMRQVGPAKPDIRKYKCRHIDVSLAAALLDDIFNGPQKARQRATAQQRGRQQQQQRGGGRQQRGRQPEPEPDPEPETGGMGRGMGMLETLFGGSGAKATDPTELMGIQVVPEKRTNYLFIMAKTDLFPQIIDTLYTVDVESFDERDSDIVVLQKLNADEVKTMLEDLLGITDARQVRQSGAAQARRAAQQRRGRGQQGQAAAELAAQIQEETLQIGVGGQQFKVSDIKISSLAATNTIIVFGPKAARKSIVDIIKKLDDQGRDVLAESFVLKKADAVSLAEALQDVYVKSGKDVAKNVTIVANEETNTIYVEAPENIRREITLRIGEAELHADGKKLRTIQLLLGDAKTIAGILSEAFDRPGRGRSEITITPDEIANRLIVSAPPDTFEQIAKLAAEMDRADPDQVLPRTIQLKYASASLVKTKVMEMARSLLATGKEESGAFAVMDDPATNSLIVVSSPTIFALVQQAVSSIDAPPEGGEIARYTLVLDHIGADVAAEMVNSYFSQHYAARGRDADIPVTVVPGPGGKHLFVNASDENKQIIDDILTKIDTQGADPADARISEVFHLIYADPTNTGGAINQAFPRGGRVPAEDLVTASIDRGTNSVIVTANERNLAKVRNLIEQLDKKPEEGIGRHPEVYSIHYADLNTLRNAINQAFNVRGSRPEEQVTAAADVPTGSLIVTANAAKHDQIAKLIKEMDREKDSSRKFRTIKMANGDAVEAARTLQQLINEWFRGRGGAKPTIVANAASNTLMMYCSDTELEQFQPLIDQMDDEEGQIGTEPQRIELVHANAAEMADLLTQIFTDSVQPRRGNRRGGGTEKIVPLIISDDASNTLIVRAAELEFGQIKKMVAKLDIESDDGPTRTRIIAVAEGMDVDSLASDIERLINRGEDIDRENNRNYKRKKVSIMADARSRSLVVSGASSQFDEVERIVRALEKEGAAGPREIRIINLKNIRSGDAKRVLDEILKKDNQSRGRRRR